MEPLGATVHQMTKTVFKKENQDVYQVLKSLRLLEAHTQRRRR